MSLDIYLFICNTTEQEQEEEEEEEEEEQLLASGRIFGPRNETIFFVIIAFAYIGVGIWMLTNRSTIGKRAPYLIAIIGSISLIAGLSNLTTIYHSLLAREKITGF